MVRDVICVLALSALFATNALAAPKPDLKQIAAGQCIVDGKPIDPKVLRDAIDIVNTTDENRGTQPTAMTFLAFTQMVREHVTNPALDDRALRLFQKAVEDELQADRADIAKAEACIYATIYSPMELQQLRSVYLSPLGKKVLANDLPVTAATVELGQDLTDSEIGRAATERAERKLRVQGLKL